MQQTTTLFRPLSEASCEQLSAGSLARCKQCYDGNGGEQKRSQSKRPQIGGSFYQINIAFNFIFGGNNNNIMTMQGNDMGSINFKVLAI
jgi:hypothetical protein